MAVKASECKCCSESIANTGHQWRLEICDGETTTLTASDVSSVWSTGATTASINVSPNTTTTYSVTVTNADGCEASTSANVVVNPLPTPAISGDLEICDSRDHNLDCVRRYKINRMEYRSNYSKYQRKSKYNNDLQRDSNEYGRL
ncbi:MAG: hypothetical protein R2766_02905 [Saprospiraceae bacterium]